MDFRKYMVDNNLVKSYIANEHLYIGKYDISIQTDKIYHSGPLRIINLYEHNSFQIQIYYNGNFVSPYFDNIFKGFKKVDELKKYYKYDYITGWYVPYQLVQELIDYLEYITICEKILRNKKTY